MLHIPEGSIQLYLHIRGHKDLPAFLVLMGNKLLAKGGNFLIQGFFHLFRFLDFQMDFLFIARYIRKLLYQIIAL